MPPATERPTTVPFPTEVLSAPLACAEVVDDGVVAGTVDPSGLVVNSTKVDVAPPTPKVVSGWFVWACDVAGGAELGWDGAGAEVGGAELAISEGALELGATDDVGGLDDGPRLGVDGVAGLVVGAWDALGLELVNCSGGSWPSTTALKRKKPRTAERRMPSGIEYSTECEQKDS